MKLILLAFLLAIVIAHSYAVETHTNQAISSFKRQFTKFSLKLKAIQKSLLKSFEKDKHVSEGRPHDALKETSVAAGKYIAAGLSRTSKCMIKALDCHDNKECIEKSMRKCFEKSIMHLLPGCPKLPKKVKKVPAKKPVLKP